MPLATRIAAPRVPTAVLRAMLGCVVWLMGPWLATGQPVGKIEFHCEPGFRCALETNETLLVAGVDVVQAADGRKYLLALGTTVNQAKESPAAQARLDTRKIAEAKARKQLAEFLETEVHTKTRLTEIRKSEKVSTNEGLKQQLASLMKVREEIITQRSEAVLGGSRVVATWLSDDQSLCNAVVAVKVEAQSKK